MCTLFSKSTLCASVLDRFLDDIFDLIPVLGIDTLDAAVEILLDLVEHVPLFPVGNERDRDTDTAETSGTTNTVQIGLEISLPFTRTFAMNFRNILKSILVLFFPMVARKRLYLHS
jgi:hypothetical protein